MTKWKKGDSVPRKPIADVRYESISRYPWDEQVAERERRFRPRVEALGSAGTEALEEMLDYIIQYRREHESLEKSRWFIGARAIFNTLCRFMGIKIPALLIYDVHSGSERGQFWEWCWYLAEKRRMHSGWQQRLDLPDES